MKTIFIVIFSSIILSKVFYSYTQFVLYNPYSFDVKLELKCDWNNKSKKFDLHEKYLLKSRNNKIIILPGYYKKCEIWPKVKLF